MRGEGGRGTMDRPNKKRGNCRLSKETGSASLMDMKEGRTRREEGHKGRKDTKGGRTQREEGHKGREDMKGGKYQSLSSSTTL